MIDNKYLLDTNICIALLRGDRDIARKIIDLGEGACHLSVITLYELMFGAYFSKCEEREVPKVKQFVERFPVVSLIDAAEEYAIIKTRLRSAGILIDEFDLMIAASALAGGYTLVTDNMKHFQPITDLKLENWIKRK